jgi:phosphate transport system permease protein
MDAMAQAQRERPSLLLSRQAQRWQTVAAAVGQSLLFLVASLSVLAVLFIFYFIIRDAWPFFRAQGFREFFTSVRWYPSAESAEYGALAIFVGSALVTLGAALVAVPLGVSAAICLSDVLPFSLRQVVKPVVEILAAIPSVAYGFFALVVLAPLLQQRGGPMMAVAVGLIGVPVAVLATAVLSDIATDKLPQNVRVYARRVLRLALLAASLFGLFLLGKSLYAVQMVSGTNALNVALILGIMALPTIVSVSEDALQSVGRELREGSYAMGATRAETLMKVVLPAARSGIFAAVILGVMRAIGETMVVWMASGNASQIPHPWYNLTQPVRTLTATIAGDMGEADQVTGSARYHVLFAMALCLLVFAFVSNLVSEWIIWRARKRMGG